MWNIKSKIDTYLPTLTIFCNIILLGNNSLFAQTKYIDKINNIVNKADDPEIAGNNGPVDQGEGYAPLLVNDYEGSGGVLSFVAQKPARCIDSQKCCEKLVIALTPAAIQDNVSVELYFHKRYPENLKWKQEDEEKQVTRITPQTPNELITILYNHAGHKGVHGGPAHRDTHHNWQLRLLKNGVRIRPTSSLWRKYLRILFSTADHSLEERYSGARGLLNDDGTSNQDDIDAFLTAEEIDKLINWGFFTDEKQAESLQIINAELYHNNLTAPEDQAGTQSFSAIAIGLASSLGLKFIEGATAYLGGEATWFVLGGIKTALQTSKGCSSSSSNLTIDRDSSGNILRYNVTLAK